MSQIMTNCGDICISVIVAVWVFLYLTCWLKLCYCKHVTCLWLKLYIIEIAPLRTLLPTYVIFVSFTTTDL